MMVEDGVHGARASALRRPRDHCTVHRLLVVNARTLGILNYLFFSSLERMFSYSLGYIKFISLQKGFMKCLILSQFTIFFC